MPFPEDIELSQEQKEEFSNLFSEIIEDIALEKAIKEGENTETVSRKAIFKILDNRCDRTSSN